jgi:hypothetical protein
MRFSLKDLLIMEGFLLLGAIPRFTLANGGQRQVGIQAILLAILAGLAVYLIFAPLLYQRLHMRPLLFPKCPKCRHGNRWYWFAKAKPDWPREVVTCAVCRTEIELWYGKPKEVSKTMPGFELCWPQSWGRWAVIQN